MAVDPLVTRFERGGLQLETVTPEDREAMLETILGPPADGLYLEIGMAGNPYAAGSDRQFGPTVRYLGIDGGASKYYNEHHRGWAQAGRDDALFYRKAAEQLLSVDRNGPHASLEWGDAQELRLPDDSVRETFMRDVLIEPGVHPDSIGRIATEQARALGAKGLLIIRETYALSYYDDLGRIPQLRILHLLDRLGDAGFGSRAFVSKTDSQAPALLERFPSRTALSGPEYEEFGYYLICQQGEVVDPPQPEQRWRRLRGILEFFQGGESGV